MPIPANGWLTVPQNAPVLPVPLPVPFRAIYRDVGGALPAAGQSADAVARIAGDATAAVVLGYDAGGLLTIEATIEQTGTFSAALIDTLTITPAAFRLCGASPDTDFAACGAAPATAWVTD